MAAGDNVMPMAAMKRLGTGPLGLKSSLSTARDVRTDDVAASVMAMPAHDRNVRSTAKKALGSSLIGTLRGSCIGASSV